MDDLGLDLSGIAVRFRGLSRAVDARVRADWRAFVIPAPSDPGLDFGVRYVDGTIDPSRYDPNAMASTLGAEEARFVMPEGRARVKRTGGVELELVRGQDAREFWTVVNLLRASLAWWLPRRGGAVLHAAGLVVDGRGFVLVGPEGSGKSSWARLGAGAGCRVLSDDLMLVDAVGRQVLGSPFRSTHYIAYSPGRWPLAAILFPHHGPDARWAPSTRLLSQARVAANLPFVADGLEADEALSSVVARLVSDVCCVELTFARDAGFVELLRQEPWS